MSQDHPRTVLIVPCYNESERLQPGPFLQALETLPSLHFLFVDDGSADNTFEVLNGIEAEGGGRVSILKLDRNQGKAEAIRQGILHTYKLNEGAADRSGFVGYWDADLSAPLTTLPLFADLFEEHPDCRLVMGSRVKLLGRTIIRKPFRHYAGRVMATVASLALDLPVYDTQCGAKLFRIDEDLEKVFADPFSDPWIFDVELLARFKALWGPETQSRIIELPLPSWEHVGGSKVRVWHGIRALVGLGSIWLRRIR
jgi:dolichyl-phosphate beta-glucosyltransferase